jgi:hypothetical protein
MIKLVTTLSLLALASCASTTARPALVEKGPSFSGTLPRAAESHVSPTESMDPIGDKNGAMESTTLPVGVGFTAGPSSFLVAGALDFPLDTKLTLGPSIEHSWDTNTKITAATAQLKLFLPVMSEGSSPFTILPYLTLGAGFAEIDKAGRSGDTGFMVNGGAGVRFLTGDHYRIGSEARVNVLPDPLDGERTYMSFQLLQVVIPF